MKKLGPITWWPCERISHEFTRCRQELCKALHGSPELSGSTQGSFIFQPPGGLCYRNPTTPPYSLPSCGLSPDPLRDQHSLMSHEDNTTCFFPNSKAWGEHTFCRHRKLLAPDTLCSPIKLFPALHAFQYFFLSRMKAFILRHVLEAINSSLLCGKISNLQVTFGSI